MRRSVGLILACAGLIAFDAKADEAPLRARLRFSSPAGCGNAADFGERVQRRAPRVRFGTRGPDSVSVRIASGTHGLDASVTLASGGRRISERQIEAETCEDALDALALVVAVTLEGQERTRRERARRSRAPVAAPAPEPAAAAESPSEAPPAEAAPEAPAATPEAASAPAPEAPAEPPPPPPPPAAPVVDTPPRAQSPGARPSWRAGVGAGAAFNVGGAPSLLPGWLVYGRFGWEVAPPWSPELILSFTSVGRDGYAEASGSADFKLQALSAELCPLRWSVGPIEWLPCALLGYGRLKVRGYDTIAPAEYDRPWTLLGASTQLALHLSIVELRAQLHAGFPLARDTFRFEPEPTVHRVPTVSFGGSIAAGLRFP